MRRLGLAERVFLSTAAIVLAVVGAALALASYAGRRAAAEAERRGLEQAADLTAQLLAGRGRSLAGGVRVFVQGPYFRSLVAGHRHDDLLDQAIEATEQLGAEWVFITDEAGSLLAKSDEPGAQGTPMAGIPLVAGALEGRTTTGYGVSRDTLLFQAVAVPIVVPVPGAAPVGVLVATRLVDSALARDIRAATSADVVFYTLDASGAPRVAASSFADARHAEAALPDASESRAAATPRVEGPRHARLGDTPFALQGAAVTTAGGEVIGGFVVGRSEASVPRSLPGVRRSLLAAGVLGLALALLAAWSAARRVTRPARTLAAAAVRALDGDYERARREAVAATAGAPPEEIAHLGTSLASLLEELREKQSLVAALGRTSDDPDHVDASVADAPPPEPARGGFRRRRSAGVASSAALPLAPRLTPAAVVAPTLVAERYAVQSVLGSGGTGIVYRAVDLTLREPVAIKMLRPELLADDPMAREELKRELRLTRRVSHRNVVRTHDFGSSGGVPFITMEYVAGTSLAALLAGRGALPADVVLALARQLARALEAAHEQGVVHGDLKPANLLVAMDGTLKVGDFGVATLVRRPAPRTGGADEEAHPPQLAGAVVGTPEYLAPEVLLGAEPDARADLYSAGMVLHECLTGTTPFQRDTPRGFLARKLEPSDPPRPHVSLEHPRPGTLEGVIAWMLAPEPADRPPSASVVISALARVS